MMKDFQSVADFMRLFVLLQGGCDTPMEQPYRAVDFKARESSNIIEQHRRSFEEPCARE